MTIADDKTSNISSVAMATALTNLPRPVGTKKAKQEAKLAHAARKHRKKKLEAAQVMDKKMAACVDAIHDKSLMEFYFHKLNHYRQEGNHEAVEETMKKLDTWENRKINILNSLSDNKSDSTNASSSDDDDDDDL